MRAIEGVYVANVTPFEDNASLKIDVEAYLAHASWLGEKGVSGVVPFGTNGEGPSVALREKLVVLEALFEERFYEPVLEATRHPIIVYHIPKYAVPVPEEIVTGLPVWGVKDSGGETGYTEAVLKAGKGVLLGTEDDLWEGLNTGAQGVISALANFMPEEVVEMHRKVEAGDEAGGKALSEKLQRARAMTKEYASAAVLKKLAEACHGTPMGTVRPPFVPAPADYDPQPTLAVSSVAGQ
ncbi:MAG: dihydrodipicolinate synthase family protein [Actinobacteria bacterium]|nr:dihydrodipicolinate synthase family protein [Actinomycetota bacterium]